MLVLLACEIPQPQTCANEGQGQAWHCGQNENTGHTYIAMKQRLPKSADCTYLVLGHRVRQHALVVGQVGLHLLLLGSRLCQTAHSKTSFCQQPFDGT